MVDEQELLIRAQRGAPPFISSNQQPHSSAEAVSLSDSFQISPSNAPPRFCALFDQHCRCIPLFFIQSFLLLLSHLKYATSCFVFYLFSVNS